MAEHAEKLSGDRMPVLARRTMFDGATVLGLAGGLLLVVLAIGLGGSASAFFNIPGLLIVVGGTFAVTTVCFTSAGRPPISSRSAWISATEFSRTAFSSSCSARASVAELR